MKKDDFDEEVPEWVKEFFLNFEYFYVNRTLSVKNDDIDEKEYIDDVPDIKSFKLEFK